MNKLYENIRNRRKELKMTQSELATEKPNKINKNPGTLDFTRNSGMYRDWIYNPLRYSILR